MRVFGGGGGGGGLSQADADLRYVRLSGATLTGPLAFSGADHAGIRLNNLTTTERDALTPAAGMVVYNSTANRVQFRNNATWEEMVRRSGDTLTGPLLLSDGVTAAPGLAFATETNTGLLRDTSAIVIALAGTRRAVFSSTAVMVGASGRYAWASIAQPAGSSTPDLALERDAADTFAQRRGANAQIFRVYETWTDASNNSYLSINAQAAGDFQIRPVANGAGTLRGLQLGVASGKLGFFGTTAATKPEVTGAHGSNAALQSLLSALATLGLITNSATA